MVEVADQSESWDFLVVGAGAAGLSLALHLAAKGRVLVLHKSDQFAAASQWAQGGIASVLDQSDSFHSHVQDTIDAGAGLCHLDIVRRVVEAGPQAIRRIIDWGAQFSQANDGNSDRTECAAAGLHLGREGGHSHRRVVHASDRTGAELMRVLGEQAHSHPNITLRPQQFVIDLVVSDKVKADFSANRCLGAYVFDRPQERIYSVASSRTFLCTGGHGKVYLYTSNPDIATGDGIAIGWRAGCKVANLEFMQFHPTCLFHPEAKTELISEALRGEGAEIVDSNGRAFAGDYHPMGSLAPRDIVARAIDFELKKSGHKHVYLDARPIGTDKLRQHFPNTLRQCLVYGIDATAEPIPIVPAAHYSCGGLVVDGQGRTSVQNLYALGEVACTGLHGANRLASNSLLEAIVFAEVIASEITAPCPHAEGDDKQQGSLEIPPWHVGTAIPADELGILLTAWDEVRRLMWNYVGIVRSDLRLNLAYDRLQQISQEIDRNYWNYEVTERLLEVRNLVQCALLTVRCARSRKESRGIHYNINYPDVDDRFGRKDTVIW